MHLNRAHETELMKLIQDADADKSEEISWDEFLELSQTAKFRTYLDLRGISINDVQLFFTMVKSLTAKEEVPVNSLVTACLRMKGFATSIDLHALTFETKLVHTKIRESQAIRPKHMSCPLPFKQKPRHPTINSDSVIHQYAPLHQRNLMQHLLRSRKHFITIAQIIKKDPNYTIRVNCKRHYMARCPDICHVVINDVFKVHNGVIVRTQCQSSFGF